jgi:hypothetical protein
VVVGVKWRVTRARASHDAFVDQILTRRIATLKVTSGRTVSDIISKNPARGAGVLALARETKALGTQQCRGWEGAELGGGRITNKLPRDVGLLSIVTNIEIAKNPLRLVV